MSANDLRCGCRAVLAHQQADPDATPLGSGGIPVLTLDSRECRFEAGVKTLRSVHHFGFLCETGGEVRCYYCDALVEDSKPTVEHHPDCIFLEVETALGVSPEKGGEKS